MGRRGSRGAIRHPWVAPLLVGGFATGCAAAREPAEARPAEPAVTPEPPAVAPAAGVRFTLELLDPETPLVGVQVETRGDSTLAEGWAGLVETGRDLELVEARGAGRLLAHERVNSYTWRVTHAPDEELGLTFELRPTNHRASSGPPEYYLPILERGLLHA